MIKRIKDKRITQCEIDLIFKVYAGILTWDEAIKIMDNFLKKLGYRRTYENKKTVTKTLLVWW